MRPEEVKTMDINIIISIHAPLTGCDQSRHLFRLHVFLFQSTHPLRDATMTWSLAVPSVFLFQSTHPLRDATITGNVSLTGLENFNPRTPYGMRPTIHYWKQWEILISIHAPLTGCDRWCSAHDCLWIVHFNPRTPYGMRPVSCADAKTYYEFQSTHPLRDATFISL